MPLYECECGFGCSSGASGESITRHLKGSHYREVNMTSSGMFYCNQCTNRHGSGRRFESFEDLLDHLQDRHDETSVSRSAIVPYHEMRFQCRDCSFGSSVGATRSSLLQHIRGSHGVSVRDSASGYFCNDCTRSNGSGRRFDSFERLMEHLEDVHYYSGATEF